MFPVFKHFKTRFLRRASKQGLSCRALHSRIEFVMARMHSKRKGKSGSKQPVVKATPDWIQSSKEEVRDLIVQFARQGKKQSEIGLILRDQYAIPSVKTLVGKSIGEVLTEEKLASQYPEDLFNLMTKAVRLHQHVGVNTRDDHNRRSLMKTESKIKRLVAYYKRSGALPEAWFYTPQNAALIVKK